MRIKRKMRFMHSSMHFSTLLICAKSLISLKVKKPEEKTRKQRTLTDQNKILKNVYQIFNGWINFKTGCHKTAVPFILKICSNFSDISWRLFSGNVMRKFVSAGGFFCKLEVIKIAF